MDLEKKSQNDPLTPPNVPQNPPPPPPGNQQGNFQGGNRNPNGLSESDEKLWGTLAHMGFVIGGFITPLVIWLVQRDKSEFVANHAKEALNFQLTVMGAFLVGFVLMILGFALGPLVIVTTILMFIVFLVAGVGSLVLGIMALIEANKGNHYRYPVNFRFIK